ncbi:MAG: class I SAM-dependent methyltransferase [Alphaproteobacteria bacterium]|nr:class I SAM-dependent methyltransferase [Alphaproteobacteria bacterium]
MKQNKYDELGFFAGYSAMPRSTGGLEAAGEWHAFRALLPDLGDKRVLDLGCGFGWHCRYAREHGALSVLGIDLSERMLARAQAATDDPAIVYRRAAIEDADLGSDAFDVVISSLALHYVERFDLVCAKVHRCLAPRGAFVLSVEHPLFTARAAQDWHYGPAGERLHWPVDDYLSEGIRRTSWLADNVIKYHRTVATYVNTLIDSGFRITRLAEPEPPPEMLAARPELSDERRRPMFLLIAARKAPT